MSVRARRLNGGVDAVTAGRINMMPSAAVTAVQCEAASVFVGVMTTTMRRVHAASTQSTSDLPASHGAM